MKKKRTWSSMAKRTACILTALCVTAAAVPGTGGYNYSEVFAAEEADDLREGLSVYLNFEDALTTNSASQSAACKIFLAAEIIMPVGTLQLFAVNSFHIPPR